MTTLSRMEYRKRRQKPLRPSYENEKKLNAQKTNSCSVAKFGVTMEVMRERGDRVPNHDWTQNIRGGHASRVRINRVEDGGLGES